MSSSNDTSELIRRYLTHQKELFGDELWVDRKTKKERPEKQNKDQPNSGNSYGSVEHDVKPQELQAESYPKMVETANSGRSSLSLASSKTGEPEDWQNIHDLEEFYNNIKDCQKCSLGAHRTKFVFGVGNPNADLLFVGEAPGRDEDLKGEPFVGRAGQLLDKILNAIDLDRSEVYIGNILKCRPPQNRDPQSGEIASCEPYLVHQIKLIDPVLIVALGRIAGQTLLRTTATLGELRGKIHDYHGTDMMVTYHPAALLRNSNFKRPTWEDMKQIKKLYLEKIEMRDK